MLKLPTESLHEFNSHTAECIYTCCELFIKSTTYKLFSDQRLETISEFLTIFWHLQHVHVLGNEN